LAKVLFIIKKIKKGKLKPFGSRKKHIKLHKVHGSLNWFWHNDQIVEDNSLTYAKECCLKRAIIPPGDAKIPEAFIELQGFFYQGG